MSKPEDKEQDNIVTLTITLNRKTGEINVSGPTHNKSYCMNMIADAIHAIVNQKPPNILTPQMVSHKA